jgi:hypothetical protein
MSKRKLAVEFLDLPLRTAKLDPEKISKVFGGCDTFGAPCQYRGSTWQGTCCDGMTCVWAGGSQRCLQAY